MAKYGNENAAAGGRSKDTGGRDASYGGGGGFGGGGKGGGGFGGAGVGGQMQKNRQNEIARTAQQTGAGKTQIGNSGRTEAGLAHDVFGGMQRDANNEGNSFIDKVGNLIARGFGLTETAPTKMDALDRVRGTSDPTTKGLDSRANWGWDPIGTAAGLAGLATGYPLGMAYQTAVGLGLPHPSINVGADVFGGDVNPSIPGTSPDAENIANRNASYMSGKPVRASSRATPIGGGIPGASPAGTTGGMIGDNAGTTADPSATDRDFGANSPAVAASRSPFNMGIGGMTGGGYALGTIKGGSSRSARTGGPSTANLAEGLRRYRGPYEQNRVM